MTQNIEREVSNSDLNSARAAKKDEFYTQYEDIEKEMNAYVEYNKDVFRDKTILCPCDDPEWSNFTKYFAANFERLGLKKLISTSYIKSSGSEQLTTFEETSPNYDAVKHKTNGKIFILDRNANSSKQIDFDDIQFNYLNGDGDFQSEEVTKLLHEADIVVTNPPFSLFRDFLKWIMNANKQFIIIGNINAVTSKYVFPYIKSDLLWLGATIHSGDRKFYVPDDYPLNASGCGIDEEGKRFIRVKGVRWFTNIDYDCRHDEMRLMSMEDNLKYNKKLIKKLKSDFASDTYPIYENYDAMEVPITGAIPNDYLGIMGVPITFLDKYCPDQFEIIGMSANGAVPRAMKLPWDKPHNNPFINGKAIYQRIMIRKRAC